MFQKAWEGRERKVAVHTRGKSGCRLASTKRAGTRGPFYRRTRPQGFDTDDFEASLGGIENDAAGPLRELSAGEPITPERKLEVARLLAAQIMRGPVFFETHERLLGGVSEQLRAQDFQAEYLASVDGDLERAREGLRAAYGNKTNSLTAMLSYAMKIASPIAEMRWHILRFEQPLLAYSDAPVVLWPMNTTRSRPFPQQHLGPMSMLEVRAPIAPNAAVLMNWIDLSDIDGLAMGPGVAAELNAFTVSQANHEWMHQPGTEPEIPTGWFSPLSRLIDPAYDAAAAQRSARHRHAQRTLDRVKGRRWVNDVEVIVDAGPQPQTA